MIRLDDDVILSVTHTVFCDLVKCWTWMQDKFPNRDDKVEDNDDASHLGDGGGHVVSTT